MCHDMTVDENGGVWVRGGVQWCVVVCGVWWDMEMEDDDEMDTKYSTDIDKWHVRQHEEGGRVLFYLSL